MSDNFDDASSESGPASSFQSLAAEGDIHAKQGDFRKAAESYTKALGMRPNEKNVLVARSRCYLALGDHRLALDDVDSALKEDKDFFKARYQKAEVLYAKGDFEMALVYYHRGHALRPELEDFRLGIQKAREAIDNSIGSRIKPRDYGLDNGNGGRRAVDSTDATGGDQSKSASDRDALTAPSQIYNKAGQPHARQHHRRHHADSIDTAKERASTRQLLGELNVDKEYFDAFLADKDFLANPNEDVQQKIHDALAYLETRTDFWRQQKPIYARRKETAAGTARARSAKR